MSPSAGFTVIVAADEADGIGRGGGLPWRLKADMDFFRTVTTGPGDGANAVILGRKTWESLPERFRPLPGRRNFVITRQPAAEFAGATRAGSFAEAWSAARAGGGEVFVIGGAEIYAAALAHPDCQRVLLTRVAGRHGCDVRFPPLTGFALREQGEERAEGPLRYCFCVYERPEPPPRG